MKNSIDFWFEFASTYSYPAAMRIEEAAAKRGIDIIWKPFLLGPIFRQQGWDDSPFNLYPARGRYMWRDLERICAKQGISFQRPTIFPQNGLLAARVACRFADQRWAPTFIRAVYRANFTGSRNIADREVIADCLVEAGQKAAEILASAKSAEAKERLRLQTQHAADLGIFGAPSLIVGNELFWGNDRLEAALDWVTGSDRPGGDSRRK